MKATLIEVVKVESDTTQLLLDRDKAEHLLADLRGIGPKLRPESMLRRNVVLRYRTPEGATETRALDSDTVAALRDALRDALGGGVPVEAPVAPGLSLDTEWERTVWTVSRNLDVVLFYGHHPAGSTAVAVAPANRGTVGFDVVDLDFCWAERPTVEHLVVPQGYTGPAVLRWDVVGVAHAGAAVDATEWVRDGTAVRVATKGLLDLTVSFDALLLGRLPAGGAA